MPFLPGNPPPKLINPVSNEAHINCFAVKCVNNLAQYDSSFGCNLKIVNISEIGACTQYHKKENIE